MTARDRAAQEASLASGNILGPKCLNTLCPSTVVVELPTSMPALWKRYGAGRSWPDGCWEAQGAAAVRLRLRY